MLKRRAARGAPTPDLDNWPDLWPSVQPVWDAFRLLVRGDGDIPLPDIVAWAGLIQMTDPDDVMEFVTLIKTLDRALADWRSEQIKSKTPTMPKMPTVG